MTGFLHHSGFTNFQCDVLLLIHPTDQLFLDGLFAEDDTSIQTDVKVPILIAFHRHIYDREWHFSCELFEILQPFSLLFFLDSIC